MPVLGTMGAMSARGFGMLGNVVTPPGQQAYTTAGTYTWIAPPGVTSVSVVAVGRPSGGQRKGGGLGWKNNIAVVPGTSYTVVVGGGTWGDSYFINTSTVAGLGPTSSVTGLYVGDGGGNGGFSPQAGGGGAGGYTDNGGDGNSGPNPGSGPGSAGAGGGGGGAGSINDVPVSGYLAGGGGGGVDILGAGSSGAGGTVSGGIANGGGAGSGGTAGTAGSTDFSSFGSPGSGGSYGGGGGFANSGGGSPGLGAVRIIWPGTTRQFPSTNTGNV